MPKTNAYYYYVQVSPNINRGVLHFKALSKKQIKYYLNKNYIAAHAVIFDPTKIPAEGVIYIDVSEIDILPNVNNVTKIANEAISAGEGEKEEDLYCMVCGTKFMGPEPKMCCSGRDCGCMGLPTEPIVCSKECYESLVNKNQKEDKQ